MLASLRSSRPYESTQRARSGRSALTVYGTGRMGVVVPRLRVRVFSLVTPPSRLLQRSTGMRVWLR